MTYLCHAAYGLGGYAMRIYASAHTVASYDLTELCSVPTALSFKVWACCKLGLVINGLLGDCTVLYTCILSVGTGTRERVVYT